MPSLAMIKWFAIGGLALALTALFALYQGQGAKLTAVKGERDVAIASAVAWSAAHGRQIELAGKTAEARAKETRQLLTIRDAAGTAKEGIANAPGASDSYRYSDSAYGFMRNDQGKAPAAPAPADSGVD